MFNGLLFFTILETQFPVRRPFNSRRVDRQPWFFELGRFDVLLDQLRSHANNMLAFPVLDHVHRLQSGDYVALCNARHLAKQSKIN